MFKESPDLEKEDIDAALCFAAQRLVHPILARPVDHLALLARPREDLDVLLPLREIAIGLHIGDAFRGRCISPHFQPGS